MGAPGDSSVEGYGSYLAIARETTYGTMISATASFAFLDFKKSSLKLKKEHKIIEEITTQRTYSKEVLLNRTVEGNIECPAYAESLAFNYLLHNAMGGTVVTATATGETVGGAAFEHSITIGNMNGSYTSLTLNSRKGQATIGKVFEYPGVKVKEMKFKAELGAALMTDFSVIAKDATQTSNDISAAYSSTSWEPLSFVSGRISIGSGLLASVTTSTVWQVHSAEWGVNNNIKADKDARSIGSDTVDVLPLGVATLSLSVTMRFNTTTAYAAMLAGTEFAAEFEFTGSTLAGSNLTRGIKFQWPRLRIAEAGDPEISGPDDVLTSQVVFHVLRDVSSASGYAVKAITRNLISSFT